MTDIAKLLTPKEVAFVVTVYLNPGSKLSEVYDYGQENEDDLASPIALWKKPEKLGLIRCVGSYKWVPNNLIMKLYAEL